MRKRRTGQNQQIQVEVYSCPQPDGYATRTDYQSGQHVPVVLDGTVVGQIAVDNLLP